MSKILLGVSLCLLCVSPYLISASQDNGSIRKVARPVKGQYIVKLKDQLSPAEVRSVANNLTLQRGGRIHYVWDEVVPSFSVELPEQEALALSRHPLVEFVEENAEWELSQVQLNAPWHLDRIDQRSLPLNGSYLQDCNATDVFAYILDTGVLGSHSEFWTSSTNSTSRVLPGKNVYPDGQNPNNPCPGVTYLSHPEPLCVDDLECFNGGHGTAVASILGGLTFGVAKQVKIIPVRTGDCIGRQTTDNMLEGLKWIYYDKPSRNGPAVLNISSGFLVQDEKDAGKEQQLLTAELWINKLINERNITVVVSANNQEVNAALTSPARLARGNGGKVITVGGTTNADRRWHSNPANPWECTKCMKYSKLVPCNTPGAVPVDCAAQSNSNPGSNYGAAVDIFAPSQNIPSAAIKEWLPAGDPGLAFGPCCRDTNTAERQGLRSGTSFAAPIVAGVAARLLMGTGSSLTPDQVWNRILTEASGNSPSTPPPVLQDVMPGQDPNAGPLNGSPNRLLFKQGVSSCTSSSLVAIVTCDNSYDLYFNGSYSGSGSDWQQAQSYNLTMQPGKNVVAIKCDDAGWLAGLLAELRVGGQRIGSNATWKVSLTAPPNWTDVNFDDSGWANATDYDPYGSYPWGTSVSGMPIDTPARWIWSSDNDADDSIYIRVSLGVQTPSPSYAGYLDIVDCNSIIGWAADRNRLNTSISVSIFDGSTLVSTVLANGLRSDVGAYLGDNGLHGFGIPIPARFKDGLQHTLRVKFESSTTELGNSPRTIFCSSNASASIAWIKPSEFSWGPPNTMTAAGFAQNGSGGVQLVWRDVTINGPWNVVSWQPTPNPADHSWSNTIPSSNRCHTYKAYVNYGGVQSPDFTYNGVNLGYCNESVRVIWIQPQSTAGFGPSGSLVVAGSATNAPSGTQVYLWYRDVTIGSGWTRLDFAPLPGSDGIWYNAILNADAFHQYQVYVTYDAITSSTCTYAGNNSISWCQ